MSKSTGSRERRMIAAEVVAIDESSAMRVVPLMVVCQVMLAPIRSPVVPPPAKAREDTDSDSQAERNPWPIDEDAWNVDPTRIKRERCSVDHPRIVLRQVNNFRICRLNHDCLSLGRDAFLRRARQVSGPLRSLTLHLNGVEDILLSVHVRIPERGGP